MEFIIGGFGACCAGVITNPLDVIKTRMQLQGELKQSGKYTVHYRNVFHAAYAIAHADGICALQKGLAPALGYQLMMNGLRLGTFHILEDSGVMRTNCAVDPLKYVCGGAFAGALGSFCGSPLYMVKTHMQTQSATIGVGHQHSHHGLVAALRAIYRRHGVRRGLWRGSASALPRVMVGSATQLTTFSAALEAIERAQVLPSGSVVSTLAASMLCGIAVAVMMTPFDVIATRLYNQGVDSSGRGLQYRGYADCVLKILHSEGPRGFYKGVTANWLRVGPHSVLTMSFWSYLKGVYRSQGGEKGTDPGSDAV